MKKLKCLTSAPARLSVAMPLMFGLATIAAAPTVEAVTIQRINIIDGRVDANASGAVDTADDLNNVALWCDDAAPIQVDIIDGGVDVTESGVISGHDDLFNCDLNDENTIDGVATPTSNQVDIRDGFVDVDEDGLLGEQFDDDAPNVKLFVLP